MIRNFNLQLAGTTQEQIDALRAMIVRFDRTARKLEKTQRGRAELKQYVRRFAPTYRQTALLQWLGRGRGAVRVLPLWSKGVDWSTTVDYASIPVPPGSVVRASAIRRCMGTLEAQPQPDISPAHVCHLAGFGRHDICRACDLADDLLDHLESDDRGKAILRSWGAR